MVSLEDVDKIVLQQLRDLGWSPADEKATIKELESSEMLSAALVCCKALTSETDTTDEQSRSSELFKIACHESMNMSSKYKLAQLLADKCSSLGYKGQLGYQTFLYGSEAELRKLLLFLLERVSAHDMIATGSDMTSEFPQHSSNILSKISAIKIPPWKPPKPPSRMSKSQKMSSWSDFHVQIPLNAHSIVTGKMAPNKKNFFDKYASRTADICSLLELNTLETCPDLDQLATVIKARKLEPDTSSGDVGPVLISPSHTKNAIIFKEASKVESRIKRLKMSRGDQSSETEELAAQKLNLERSVLSLKSTIQDVKKQSVDRKVMALSVDDLESVRDKVQTELTSMRDQWEQLKQELNTELEQLRSDPSVQAHRAIEEEAIYLKEQIHEKTEQISAREDQLAALQEKVSSIKEWPPGRSSYTKRILEIVANIKKQQAETGKLLKELRDIQKDINDLGGKVSRSFTLVEETIFKDAKQGTEFHRKCYKLLAALHSAWDQLLDDLEQIGHILRESHSIEESLETERGQEVEKNLIRLRADFEQLHRENENLAARLESSSRQSSSSWQLN